MSNRDRFRLLVVSLAISLAGCVSGYKQFYQQAPGATPDAVAARRANPPPAVPVVERSQPADASTILDAYARRGFILVGYSMFNSGRREPERNAVNQGTIVGADLVLILNPKYTGSITGSVPIVTPTTTTSYSSGTATAYGPGGTVTAHGSGTTTTYGTQTTYVPFTVHRVDYGAIYFVKQKLPLGVFMRDLDDSERKALQSNRGAAVHVVADGSPAFYADILPGDLVTAVNGVAVENAKGMIALLQRYAGQRVSIAIFRGGQHIEKTVQLNP